MEQEKKKTSFESFDKGRGVGKSVGYRNSGSLFHESFQNYIKKVDNKYHREKELAVKQEETCLSAKNSSDASTFKVQKSEKDGESGKNTCHPSKMSTKNMKANCCIENSREQEEVGDCGKTFCNKKSETNSSANASQNLQCVSSTNVPVVKSPGSMDSSCQESLPSDSHTLDESTHISSPKNSQDSQPDLITSQATTHVSSRLKSTTESAKGNQSSEIDNLPVAGRTMIPGDHLDDSSVSRLAQSTKNHFSPNFLHLKKNSITDCGHSLQTCTQDSSNFSNQPCLQDPVLASKSDLHVSTDDFAKWNYDDLDDIHKSVFDQCRKEMSSASPDMVSRPRSASTSSDGACRSSRERKQRTCYSDSDFVYDLARKRKCSELEGIKRKRKRLVPGVDFIVTGKFKGHRRMAVHVKKLNITNGTVVLASDFSNSHYRDGFLSERETNGLRSNGMLGSCDNIFEKFQNCCETKPCSGTGTDESSKDSTYFQSKKGLLSLSTRRNSGDIVEISSSDESNMDGCSNENRSKLVHKSNDPHSAVDNDDLMDIKDSCDENESDSTGKQNKKTSKKKKKMTKNQRLHMAFTSASYKTRRKKSPVHSGKLMTSLSLLHEATIANLVEPVVTNGECLDDCKSNYEDVMFKLSLFSPPNSDKGDNSPPQPLSPEEFTSGQRGITWSTSDAQSVVMENGLSPISPDKEDDMSPVYPQTGNSTEGTVRISVDESPEKHQRHESRNRTIKQTANQINLLEKDALDPSHGHSCMSSDSPDSVNTFHKKDSVEIGSVIKNENGQNLETLKANEEVAMNCNELGENTLSQKSNSSLDSIDVIEPSPDANESHFKHNFLKTECFLGEIKDVNCSMYNCQEIRRTRLTSKVHLNSPSKLGPLHFKRKAVVKLQPLSLHEIEKYCSGKISFDKLEGKENIPVSNNGLDSEMETNGEVSPPDLGPPNIPKFEKEEIEEFNTPPKLLPSHPSKTSLQSSPVTDKTACESGLERSGDLKSSGCETNSSKNSQIQTEENEDSIVNTTQKNCLNSGQECVGLSDNKELVNLVKQDEMTCDEQVNTRKKASDESETSETKSVKNGEKTGENVSKSKGKSKTLYTPLRRPPTRQSVRETASTYGLRTSKNQPAFCSNPDDVPEKPRELGGRVLNLQSNRVSLLPDFESTVVCEGIVNYRNIMMINDQIFNTQTENDNLLHQMDKESELRFALLGDRKITITPCRPAPSRASVETWLKKHELYKKTKLMKEFKNVNKNNVDKVDQINQQKQCDNIPTEAKLSSKSSHVEGIPKNSLVKELSFDNNMEDNVINDQSPSPVKVIRITRHKSEQGQSFDDSQENDIISPSPPSEKLKISRWDRTDSSLRLSVKKTTNSPVTCSPVYTTLKTPEVRYSKDTVRIQDKSRELTNGNTPKSVRVSESKFHSTPLQKKRLSRLFDPTVTPIANKVRDDTDQAASKTVVGNCSDSGPGFLAPRHIPLPRRMSGTENNLRSSLMSDSQMKQFVTPLNKKGSVSQIDGPTPKNSFGFKVSQQNLQDAKALHEVQNLTVISLELHAESRRDLRPDPEVDQILAIFYEIYNDSASEKVKKNITGAIIVDKKSWESQKAFQKRQKEKSSIESGDDTKTKSDSPQPSTSRDSTVNPRPTANRSPSPQPSTSSDLGPKFGKSPTNPKQRKKARSRSPSPSPSKVPKTDNQYIEDTLLQKSGVGSDLQVTYVQNEEELFDTVIELILKWDPDILVGYEIQNFSWGYLLQRASHLSINLCAKISRIPDEKKKSSFKAESDEWGAAYSSEIHLAGRIILNLWRLLRHEVSLNIYTFENIAFHVLHQRIPHFTAQTLNSWFQHRTHLYRWRFIQHYQTRVKGNMQIIDQLDLIGRTSEFARVFGIEFYHVLSRGSQYRVESMMLRIAKPLNFIPVSPSVQQRARMRAPECIALTLEPESKFYSDPVVVLDFQSLYPSIMIAHNYCFSTCVGRLQFLEKAHEGAVEFGATHLRISPGVLNKIKDDVTVSPNGVVFVKQHVRKGIISSMVDEILKTRIMVKKGMKDHKKDKGLHRLLDARQLGLKLIANVTYGYTAANYSGRMPCIEVADSIVRKARETLERAIKLVEDTPQWGARVVYGDTDSMFIELKGRSKEEAFKIGYEICDAVTDMNPKPMKLKFEKVYLPCVLQTKKRYVGYSYETPDQKEPIFDAKGIETVRRDACSAVSKILERSVKILFNSKDVSLVKEYVLRQCKKLMEGKVSMQDCIFAKEYRGMKGYKPGACVPALEISKKLLRHDRRAEPRVGERVPYVIVYGSPGLPLIQLVRQPHEILNDATLRLNATYYIVKQILPPLDRVFSLLGVNVFQWYNDMPKVTRMAPMSSALPETRRGTISQYFHATNCPVCDKQTNQSICADCMKSPPEVCVTLCDRIRTWEKVQRDLMQICNTCMGCQDEKQPCDSLDCPIMFRRLLSERDVNKGSQLRDIITKMLDF